MFTIISSSTTVTISGVKFAGYSGKKTYTEAQSRNY